MFVRGSAFSLQVFNSRGSYLRLAMGAGASDDIGAVCCGHECTDSCCGAAVGGGGGEDEGEKGDDDEEEGGEGGHESESLRGGEGVVGNEEGEKRFEAEVGTSMRLRKQYDNRLHQDDDNHHHQHRHHNLIITIIIVKQLQQPHRHRHPLAPFLPPWHSPHK